MPGNDGILIEFYVAFQQQLIPVLIKLYNEIYSAEQMPNAMYRGIIKQVYKNKGNKVCCTTGDLSQC